LFIRGVPRKRIPKSKKAVSRSISLPPEIWELIGKRAASLNIGVSRYIRDILATATPGGAS
jgi:hypothetical protein